jgi:DNA-binding transcriptional MocR family regulator
VNTNSSPSSTNHTGITCGCPPGPLVASLAVRVPWLRKAWTSSGESRQTSGLSPSGRGCERGYVTARVGRGTFVRTAPPSSASEALDDDWQLVILPERRTSLAAEALMDSFRITHDRQDVISLAAGFPSPDLAPAAQLARITAEVFDHVGRDALAYIDSEGLPELREELARRGTGSGLFTATLNQHIAARYLASGEHERQLARGVPHYRERRDALLGALELYLGDEARWLEPIGGHHVWVTLRRPIEERTLWLEALRTGVAFTPGSATMVEPGTRTALRLSFSMLPPDRLEEGVRRLARAVRAAHRIDRRAASAPLS